VFDRIAADLILVIHFGFIAFVALGGFLVLKWPWIGALHVPAWIWGALIEFSGWTCPLTPLEQTLRRTAGGSGYQGSFIEHYLLRLVYPDELTRTLQLAIGAFVVALNGALYSWLVFRRLRSRKQNT
jgi:hypothetical protein